MKYLWVFLFLFLLSVIIFLAHFLVVGTVVYGDGRFYYSYLPTFYIEHSLNFTNSFSYFGIKVPLTTQRIPGNVYAIGPAIVWAIPYMITFLLLGGSNQYSILLQIPVGILDCALVICGLYFVFQSLKKFFSIKIALTTVITMYLTTNLFFYGAIDVINSHSVSFFFASLLVFLILHEKKSLFYTMLTGISVGMLMLIRTQDSIFLILPFSYFILSWKKRLWYFVQIAGVFSLSLFYQFTLWQTMWGNGLKSPYLYNNYFDLLHPQILGVLFNTSSGLFLWTPIIAVAVIGLFFFAKKYKTLGIPAIAILLLELYIVSSWNIWWEGASYSARMFISSLPLLSFGLAYVLQKTWHTYRTMLILAGFSILNFLLIILFLLKFN